MSPAKIKYTEARGAYDAALAALASRTLHLDWEADFDAAFEAETAVRAELGMDALSAALAAAESEVVEWGERALSNAGQPVPHEVTAMLAAARKNVAVRQRLIPILMKLAA